MLGCRGMKTSPTSSGHGIKASTTIDFEELEAYLTGFWLTDLANFSAYLWASLADINWVGFYLDDGSCLRLGPFQGKVACTEIHPGRGVCGTSFAQRKSLIVDDVDQFPDHIRCDTQSRSEIVIPFFLGENCVGVLDVDSPSLARFQAADQVMLEKALRILSQKLSDSLVKSGQLGQRLI